VPLPSKAGRDEANSATRDDVERGGCAAGASDPFGQRLCLGTSGESLSLVDTRNVEEVLLRR
jgi:hypothetical protein